MTEKLLPCPFCGGEANQTSELGADCYSHWVICQSCGAKTLTYYDSLYPTTAKKMAKAAWNRRAQPENNPLTCDGCKWRQNRLQKCNCCRRNRNMADLYEEVQK